jgi:hypothetical protein
MLTEVNNLKATIIVTIPRPRRLMRLPTVAKALAPDPDAEMKP